MGHGFPWTERESKKKASAFYRSGSQTGIHLLLEDSEYNDAGQHRNSDGSKHCRVVKTELAGEIAQGQGQGPVVSFQLSKKVSTAALAKPPLAQGIITWTKVRKKPAPSI